MKLFSIDIETTGLDENLHQTLEIWVAFWDTNTEFKRELIDVLCIRLTHDKIDWDKNALFMNAALISEIERYKRNPFETDNNTVYVMPYNAIPVLKHWIEDITQWEAANIVWKNFGSFDLKFLNKLWFSDALKYRRRIVDVWSVYLEKTDDVVPDLSECKRRAWMDDTIVKHEAVEDALDVLELVNNKFIS